MSIDEYEALKEGKMLVDADSEKDLIDFLKDNKRAVPRHMNDGIFLYRVYVTDETVCSEIYAIKSPPYLKEIPNFELPHKYLEMLPNPEYLQELPKRGFYSKYHRMSGNQPLELYECYQSYIGS